MQNSACIRQRLYELASAACMVQVHMGQENIVDGSARDPESVERRKQVGNRVVRSDIDEGRAARVFNDMRGGVARMQILRIYGRDAMGVA
jgi:hypothetical protein